MVKESENEKQPADTYTVRMVEMVQLSEPNEIVQSAKQECDKGRSRSGRNAGRGECCETSTYGVLQNCYARRLKLPRTTGLCCQGYALVALKVVFFSLSPPYRPRARWTEPCARHRRFVWYLRSSATGPRFTPTTFESPKRITPFGTESRP